VSECVSVASVEFLGRTFALEGGRGRGRGRDQKKKDSLCLSQTSSRTRISSSFQRPTPNNSKQATMGGGNGASLNVHARAHLETSESNNIKFSRARPQHHASPPLLWDQSAARLGPPRPGAACVAGAKGRGLSLSLFCVHAIAGFRSRPPDAARRRPTTNERLTFARPLCPEQPKQRQQLKSRPRPARRSSRRRRAPARAASSRPTRRP
jgi:hypothetical protein